MISQSQVLDLDGVMAMPELPEWFFPVAIALVVAAGAGTWLFVLHRKEQEERRKKRAEAISTRARSRIENVLPSFDRVTPELFGLAEQLGIDRSTSSETLQELDGRLTRDAAVLRGLTQLKGMVDSCAEFVKQIEAIGEFISLEVTHRWNEVQRPLGAPERGQHRRTVQKQLELLKPLEEVFKAERERFRDQVRDLLTNTVCQIANGNAWQESFRFDWSALLRNSSFESIGLKAIKATRANALGWSP